MHLEERPKITSGDGEITPEMAMEYIVGAFQEVFEGYTITEHFRQRTIARYFLYSLPLDKIIWAMEEACEKFSDDKTNALRYFCGICHGMLRVNWRPLRDDER